MRSQQRSSSGNSELTRIIAFPGRRQFVDEAVDILLGADVDAARRVVQEQHVGLSSSQRASSTFC